MTRAKQKKPDQIKLQMDPPRNVVAEARRVIQYHVEAQTEIINDWRALIDQHQQPNPMSLWHLAHQIEIGTEDVLKAAEFLRIIVPVAEYTAPPGDAVHLDLRDKLTTAIKGWKEQALSGAVVQHGTSVMLSLRVQAHYLALLKAISVAEEALLELTDTRE
jgi:hypothetical protein